METKDILLKINELNATSQLLEIPENQRLEMLKDVSIYANHFIEVLSMVKAFRDNDVDSLKDVWKK